MAAAQKRKHGSLDAVQAQAEPSAPSSPEMRVDHAKTSVSRRDARPLRAVGVPSLTDPATNADPDRVHQHRCDITNSVGTTEAAASPRRRRLKAPKIGPPEERILQPPQGDMQWGDRYIERQNNAECGRHALNNVLGVAVFTHEHMQVAARQVMQETDTQHEESEHINHVSGWYSHSVLAQVLQNVRDLHLRLRDRPVASADYTFMLNTESIRGAVINEHGLHWSAIVKHNGHLWHVDSRWVPPRVLTAATFAALIRSYTNRVLYVHVV